MRARLFRTLIYNNCFTLKRKKLYGVNAKKYKMLLKSIAKCIAVVLWSNFWYILNINDVNE